MKRLILSVSMVAALAACSRASSSPAGVVEDFMRKMESGNCTGIGDSLAASSKAMGPKLEQACSANAAMKKEMKQTKTVSSVNKVEETINGDRATVRLEAVYSDGTKEGGEPIVVVRENGAWKIDLMATGMSQGAGGGAGGGMGPGPSPTTPPVTTAPPAMTPPAAPAPAPVANDTAEEAESEEK